VPLGEETLLERIHQISLEILRNRYFVHYWLV